MLKPRLIYINQNVFAYLFRVYVRDVYDDDHDDAPILDDSAYVYDLRAHTNDNDSSRLDDGEVSGKEL
jgi:hypothetical protein